jgi:hypothetical protein
MFQSEPTTAPPRSRTYATRFDARLTLESIARPRLTGSSGAKQVTREIRDRLQNLGYEVRDYPFQFSTWPGRFGVSLAGAAYLGGALLAARMLYQGYSGVALVALIATLVVIAGIAMLARSAITALRWGRVEAVNLVAHMPGKRPRYYIMAHRDSKSQPVPLAFRGPAIVFAILAWIALTVATVFALLDPIFMRSDMTVVLGVIAVVAGAILVLCWVDNRSPGALDNASGVATLIGIAEREAANGDVALIVTDAEELGLAGARAIAPLLPACFGVINLDGIDDDGRFYIIERFGWPKKKGVAPHLAAALLWAADQLNHEARRRDVPIGLLLDHIPIVNAGTPAVTVMRGSLASLQRVHRPADSLSHLLGTGVTQGVSLICAALQRMRETSP